MYKQREQEHQNLHVFLKCYLQSKKVFKRSNSVDFYGHLNPSQHWVSRIVVFRNTFEKFKFREPRHNLKCIKTFEKSCFYYLKLHLLPREHFLLNNMEKVSSAGMRFESLNSCCVRPFQREHEQVRNLQKLCL